METNQREILNVLEQSGPESSEVSHVYETPQANSYINLIVPETPEPESCEEIKVLETHESESSEREKPEEIYDVLYAQRMSKPECLKKQYEEILNVQETLNTPRIDIPRPSIPCGNEINLNGHGTEESETQSIIAWCKKIINYKLGAACTGIFVVSLVILVVYFWKLSEGKVVIICIQQ